jgi:DNA-directed RNA polymerase specialized sigma24 family protein
VKKPLGVPPPPRDEQSFREFYTARRTRMIGLVRVQTTGKVSDPELVTEEGWCKFHPHWKDCEHPDAYVRQCMVSAANDALRKAISGPRVYSMDAESVFARTLAGPEPPVRPADPDKPLDPELTDALQRLRPKLREFVLLDTELNLGERPVAEIAEILGIGRTAAYARRKRAYTELRRLLPANYLELRAARRRGQDGAEGWSTP